MDSSNDVPGRSDEPFFHQPQTGQFIKDIAQSTNLVIYAGAGATITESGHSWDSMVDLLSARLADNESAVQDAIAESFNLPKRSSIVKEYFRRTAPKAAPEAIANILRTALYQKGQWKRGDYATSIAVLCIEKLALGHKVTVVTTNYDQYLELAFRRTGADGNTASLVECLPLPLEGDLDASKVIEDLAKVENQVPVVHLHGVILEERDPNRSEDVVLDEADYLRTESQTSAVLTSLLSSNDLLVLGSSIEDDPLMRALWRTRESGRNRWAVFPRQNYAKKAGAYGGHAETYNDLIFALDCRCRLFKLKIIAPDFFSQSPQFVREVAIACEYLQEHSGNMDYSQVSYGKRLEGWWSAWLSTRANSTRAATAAQRRDHKNLAGAVRIIQKGSRNTREKLKLELWVRWAPSSTDHSLRLWASSTGTWVDYTTMRNVTISVYSEYLAVEAFCSGVAVTYKRDGREHERWKKYLAVPVRVGAEPQEIQVGVIVLATTEIGDNSIIDENSREALRTLSYALGSIGEGLLGPS